MKATTLLFALLLLLSSFSAMAQSELQRFTVTPMEVPRTVAVFPDHPDKAAIIFESTLTNLRFDSQMDGIVQIRDESASGRYILIIEPFTQIISITAPGFIQERLRIGTPEPREVRYFSVAPEERRQDVISVIFNVTPSDARLFVDDQQTDINQTVQIEPGSRAIRIEREGYRSVEDQVTVSPANILFTYSLQQVQQELVRITIPSLQADVSIDNVREGATDARGVFEMFRFPGTYQLRITADGYLPLQQVIEVTEGGANIFTYNLERNIGTLRLDISPSDAVVMVNRQQRRLVNGEMELPPGLHSIEISRSQHDSYSENIRIERGETTHRNIQLVAHMGALQLVVSPSDARVRLLDSVGNEVDNWVGSRNRGELLVGDYTLEISAQGYTAATRQVVIERNETNNLRVALTQSAPATARATTPTTRPATDSGPSVTQTRDVGENVANISWLLSGEFLRIPSKTFELNYGSPLMQGLSVGVAQSLGERMYWRVGVGSLTTSSSDTHVFAQSGRLWYLYGQPALGLQFRMFKIEGSANLGTFFIEDKNIDELRKQSFVFVNLGSGVSLTTGLELMLNYAVYTQPDLASTVGLRLSWRIDR